MNRRHVLLTAATWVLFGQSYAHGQRETERFIPIGQSPGASEKSTRIGTVSSIDPRARSFDMVTPSGRYKVAVPERTRIWLDRSRQKLTALAGSFKDLQTGRRVEVKFQDPEREKRVEWIKVEIETGPPAAR